jgi:hypothetical protein
MIGNIILILLACGRPPTGPTTGSPRDSAHDADTAAESSSETGSRAGAAVPCGSADDARVSSLAAKASAVAALSIGTCDALIDPWVLEHVDDVQQIWTLMAIDAKSDWNNAFFDADELCPCETDGVREWDCVSDGGWVASGNRSIHAGSSMSYRFRHWAASSPDGSYTYMADGANGYSGNQGGYGQWFQELRESATPGGLSAIAKGVRIRDGGYCQSAIEPAECQGRYINTSNDGFYIRVVDDKAISPGDMCVRSNVQEVASCPDEGVGTFVVSGAQDVVVSYDGDIDCDGCGTVAVDGVVEGILCASPM